MVKPPGPLTASRPLFLYEPDGIGQGLTHLVVEVQVGHFLRHRQLKASRMGVLPARMVMLWALMVMLRDSLVI